MAVGLQLATKNSFVRVQEDINDNLTKLDEAIDFNLLATLGIEYGGILNNTNAKTSGKAYYDTTGKKLYKCIANTSINYADAGYFEALSNNDLLGKLQNLYTQTISESNWDISFFKVNNLVIVRFDFSGVNVQEVLSRFSIPQGFIPKSTSHATLNSWTTDQVLGVKLNTDGHFTVSQSKNGTFIGTGVYFI